MSRLSKIQPYAVRPSVSSRIAVLPVLCIVVLMDSPK